jgi:hypothetical protein
MMVHRAFTHRWPISQAICEEAVAEALRILRESPNELRRLTAIKLLVHMDLVNARREATERDGERQAGLSAFRSALGTPQGRELAIKMMSLLDNGQAGEQAAPRIQDLTPGGCDNPTE